jgi:hypothetical protein
MAKKYSAPTPTPVRKPKAKKPGAAPPERFQLDRSSLTTILILSGVVVATIIFMIIYRRSTINAAIEPVYAVATQAVIKTATANAALAQGIELPTATPEIPLLEDGLFRGGGISLRAPAGWAPFDPRELPGYGQARSAGGEILLAASPPGSGSALIVTRIPSQPGGTLEQFVKALAPVTESNPDAVLTSEEIELDGLPAVRRNLTLPGEGGGEGVRVVQVFLMPASGAPTIYIVELSASETDFQAEADEIEAMLESIKITE